jgi:3-oxoacyl-[acyl-carrier protein] reductase
MDIASVAVMDSQFAELEGLRAVVTGSTRGIGKAIALELARGGAAVVVHGRDPAAADDVCRAVREFKRQAEAFVTDVSESAARLAMVEQLWRQRPVDVWINNAGADVLTGAAAELPFMDKLHLLGKVDVEGTIEFSREVGQRMRQRGRGVIINIGWDQVETGMEGDSGEMFGAAKGAIMGFTRSVARSLAPEVRVNCIAPGWIRTAWGHEASEYWQVRAVAESLMQRWGEPEDIARAARFLASPAASFITGQIINVNGGRAS